MSIFLTAGVRGRHRWVHARFGNVHDSRFAYCDKASVAAHRDKAAARRCFEKAIDQNGGPQTITVDRSEANLAALQAVNTQRKTPIRIRQVKYPNNIVEQDHRAIKRIIKAMIGFKDFRCARIILSGIEVINMMRKGQLKRDGIQRTAAGQFYSLVI